MPVDSLWLLDLYLIFFLVGTLAGHFLLPVIFFFFPLAGPLASMAEPIRKTNAWKVRRLDYPNLPSQPGILMDRLLTCCNSFRSSRPIPHAGLLDRVA